MIVSIAATVSDASLLLSTAVLGYHLREPLLDIYSIRFGLACTVIVIHSVAVHAFCGILSHSLAVSFLMMGANGIVSVR